MKIQVLILVILPLIVINDQSFMKFQADDIMLQNDKANYMTCVQDIERIVENIMNIYKNRNDYQQIFKYMILLINDVKLAYSKDCKFNKQEYYQFIQKQQGVENYQEVNKLQFNINCFKDIENVYKQFQALLKDITSKNYMDILHQIQETIPLLQQTEKDCNFSFKN